VVRRHDGLLSRQTLLRDVTFLAANRYRDLAVPLNSKVRFDILAGVLEMETAIDSALRGPDFLYVYRFELNHFNSP
jgi:hypothetical protein